MTAAPHRLAQLVDVVFPGDTNHHQTLFGGVGLAHMDKVAFIAAARHAPVDFVTASCERIDFTAPANLGDIVEFTASLVRVGGRSLTVAVDMVAEATLSGERRLCGRGTFNMVAIGERVEALGGRLPPMAAPVPDDGRLRMVELVFPDEASHYDSLHGGRALAAMSKAAFVAATRHARRQVVLVSVREIDFASQVEIGEIIELAPRVVGVGRTSMTVHVELWAESLRLGRRRLCAAGDFILVSLDGERRPAAGAAAPA